MNVEEVRPARIGPLVSIVVRSTVQAGGGEKPEASSSYPWLILRAPIVPKETKFAAADAAEINCRTWLVCNGLARPISFLRRRRRRLAAPRPARLMAPSLGPDRTPVSLDHRPLLLFRSPAQAPCQYLLTNTDALLFAPTRNHAVERKKAPTQPCYLQQCNPSQQKSLRSKLTIKKAKKLLSWLSHSISLLVGALKKPFFPLRPFGERRPSVSLAHTQYTIRAFHPPSQGTLPMYERLPFLRSSQIHHRGR